MGQFSVKKLLAKQNLKKAKEDQLKRKVFVGGLPKSATESQLESYFSKFGKIEDILVNRSIKTGVCKGCAFILFKDQKVAQNLIEDPTRHPMGEKMVEVKSCHKKGSKCKNTSSTFGTRNMKKQKSSLKCFSAQSQASVKKFHPSPIETRETLTNKLSPLIALASPLPEIEFTPLEELEDDSFVLEEPVKRVHKISKSFDQLPDLQEEAERPRTPKEKQTKRNPRSLFNSLFNFKKEESCLIQFRNSKLFEILQQTRKININHEQKNLYFNKANKSIFKDRFENQSNFLETVVMNHTPFFDSHNEVSSVPVLSSAPFASLFERSRHFYDAKNSILRPTFSNLRTKPVSDMLI